jgi:type II secretory pathway pseudopilin PulG
MRNSRGFSLLELLIVAGIFMFVLVPVLMVFTSSYESYLVQDDISATQQSIRSATMYLRRDIRMAGAGLGDGFFMFDLFDEDEDGDLSESVRVYGISAGNGTGPKDGTDELVVRYVNLDAGLCEGNGASDPYCSDLPTLSLPGGMPKSSAEVEVDSSTDLNSDPYDKWTEDCNCGPDSYTVNGNYFLPVIITSPDGRTSDLMIVTAVQANAGQEGGRVQNHKVQNFDFRGDTFSIENKIANDYPSGSTISFFNVESYETVRYYLTDDDVLMREVNGDAQPLAEGIEDLQFDYFGDFDADDASEWYNLTYNFGADGNFTEEDDQEEVRMVRMRVLARTSREWRDLGDAESPDLDQEDGTGTRKDQFRRRVIEQDVQVRNLGL